MNNTHFTQFVERRLCHEVTIDTYILYSFSKVLEQKEQLEQKHLHLLQIMESERQAKWHYVQQTEELTAEVKKLKSEVSKI